MRIKDILHGQIQPDDSAPKRREKEQIENCASSAIHQLYITQREKRIEDIRMKLNSGFYEQREVLGKVADAIYRHIRQ